ncbi:PaaI family thioesterase [Cryptosporangium japonicum]|uniref:Acyl-coenzyme A thioesterase THEM4 n=1 Tax=Cryptosporangium japonicum TaxID=80872 RepID=A0ABN0TGD1_9ACTN
MGDALRAALTAAATAVASPAELRKAAAAIRDAIEPLTEEVRSPATLSPLDDMGRGIRMFNPVVGPGNGFALPLRFEPDGDGVLARATLGPVHEGPPTFVHGGVSALLMDQILGQGAIVTGRWGMTAELTLRYRRPVPLHTPLLLTSRMAGAAGRRTTVTGAITTEAEPEVVLVEAMGLFVSPSEAKTASYFGTVRTASGGETDGRLGHARQDVDAASPALAPGPAPAE